MVDFTSQIKDTERHTGPGHIPAGDGRTVSLRRRYDAPIEDVWEAITDPERIPRWFLPVTGEFRVGGKYQLEGNAGGEILQCDPPRTLKVTWVFGEAPTEKDITEVVVRLSEEGEGETLFELEHTAVVDPKMWAEYGPGAVGVGWDLALLGLGLHLQGGKIDDPIAWQMTPEARDLVTWASKAWGAALAAAGGSPEEVDAAISNTTKFYAPEV